MGTVARVPPETALLQAVINGITTGSMIALGAIGLSMVYSIGKVPNFAHGDLLTIGAYLALLVNTPTSVPWFNQLAPGTQVHSVGAEVILFVLTAAGVLGGVYALGRREALLGSWWPVDPPPYVALGTHLAVAAIAGLVVALGAPSIIAAMVFAGAVMAGATPLLERFVFDKFRQKDASLVMMLMASLALAFVLRFSVQTYFGGTTKSYAIEPTMTVFGFTFDVAFVKFFDIYLSGSGLAFQMIDPANDAVLVTATYSLPVVAVVVGASLVGGYLAYRWRLGTRAILGPYLLGSLVALGIAALAGVVLQGSAPIPESPIYSTRFRMSVLRGFIIVLALVMMGSLHSVLRATKLGKAMRATSDNRDLAKVRGINTEQVTMGVWIFSGVMAGVAGVTLGFLFGVLTVNTGFFLLLPMFAAVIVGGLTIYGAILGSYVVGLAMEVGIFAIPGLSATYRIPLAFVVLIIVLIVKPEGITG